MKTHTVLISGGGVAGRALAFWLLRHGFVPTIVERAPGPRHGGYKVDIRGAATEVVRRMGLLDEVRRASTDMRTASFVNDAGRQLATMDAELLGGRSGDDIEIVRGDLTRVLQAATDTEMEVTYGNSVVAINETSDGVEVTFAAGPSRIFDLVVGADGLHSGVRAVVLGSEAKYLRHLGYDIAIFTVPNRLGLDRAEVALATPGRTALIYSTGASADATAMFLFASASGGSDRDAPEHQRHIVADAFAGRGWEVPRLLDQMWAAPDFYFDSISQIHMDRWSAGRVVLVGDAAYAPSPASGQGTSLALVGAYVLAGELADTSGDVGAAVIRYEAAMRGFADRNQQLAGRNIKGMVLGSRAQIRFQLLMLRLLPHLPGRERIAGRIGDGITSAANSIVLRDYGAGVARGSPDAAPSQTIAGRGIT